MADGDTCWRCGTPLAGRQSHGLCSTCLFASMVGPSPDPAASASDPPPVPAPPRKKEPAPVPAPMTTPETPVSTDYQHRRSFAINARILPWLAVVCLGMVLRSERHRNAEVLAAAQLAVRLAQ